MAYPVRFHKWRNDQAGHCFPYEIKENLLLLNTLTLYFRELFLYRIKRNFAECGMTQQELTKMFDKGQKKKTSKSIMILRKRRCG